MSGKPSYTALPSKLTCRFSYDLNMDKKLAEETTTLVEQYEVGLDPHMWTRRLTLLSASRWAHNQGGVRALRGA